MTRQKWSFFILIGCPGRDRTCDILINGQMFYRWTTGQLWKFYFLWISLNQFFQFLFREITESRNTLTVSLLHITGCHFFMIRLGRTKTFVTVTCDETRITFFMTCWSHIRHIKFSLESYGSIPSLFRSIISRFRGKCQDNNAFSFMIYFYDIISWANPFLYQII